MARQEEDREDLLADATALVERVEFLAPGVSGPLLAGFRRDGGLSLYVDLRSDAERAYHFNSRGELRRAFVAGLIYKAQRRRLAALRRERTAGRVELVRHDLSAAESAAFLGELASCLAPLRAALIRGTCEVCREVPAGKGVLRRLAEYMEGCSAAVAIAESPRSG